MKCKICSNLMEEVFKLLLIKKYEVQIYSCDVCGFCSTEPPFWLNEAYLESQRALDTGALNRNLKIADTLRFLLPSLTIVNEPILDFAGGSGILVRLMRDIGYNFYWEDLYEKNNFARGFESDNDRTYIAITAIEVLEHMIAPMDEILEIITRLSPKYLIFTQCLIPKNLDPEWWYFAHESGQHISFYEFRTLELIAEKLNMKLYNFDELFIFSTSKLDFNLQLRIRYWLYLRSKYVANKIRRKLIPEPTISSLTQKDYNLMKILND